MLADNINEAAIGGLYSQLTGVLAGLSFTALIFLLDGRRRRDEASTSLDDSIAYLIFCSFAGLAISSLTYAVIGGDQDHARAALEHVVAAPGFTASGLNLFFATYALFMSTRRDDAADRAAPPRAARAVTAFFAPLVGLVFTLSGLIPLVVDGIRLTWGVALLGLPVGAGGVALVWLWLAYRPHRHAGRAGISLGSGALALAVGSASGTVAVNTFTSTAMANRGALALLSTLGLVAFLAVFCLVASQLPLPAEADGSSPREPGGMGVKH